MLRTRGAAFAGAVVVAATLVTTSALMSGVAAGGTKPPSRDAYIERADSICKKTTGKIDTVVEDVGLSPSDDEAREAVDEVVVLSRKELRKLRALRPPRSEAERIGKVYRAIERALDRIEADPGSLFDEPGPFSRAARRAEAYGFEECGQG